MSFEPARPRSEIIHTSVFQTFTFHFDQGRLLLVWICVPLTYCGNMYFHLLGTPRLAITQSLTNDFGFNVLFNTITVISGTWMGDNERLCAMELPSLRLKRFRSPASLEQGTARSAVQRLT